MFPTQFWETSWEFFSKKQMQEAAPKKGMWTMKKKNAI